MSPPGRVALTITSRAWTRSRSEWNTPLRVREVEVVLGQGIAGHVVDSELEVDLVADEEPVVDIRSEHFAVGGDERGERPRDRSTPRTDLETLPSRPNLEPPQPADRRLVEQRTEILQALAFQLRGFVGAW